MANVIHSKWTQQNAYLCPAHFSNTSRGVQLRITTIVVKDLLSIVTSSLVTYLNDKRSRKLKIIKGFV